MKTLKSNAMELLGVGEDGGQAKTERELKQEREELIKAQKQRLASEKKYKNHNKNPR